MLAYIDLAKEARNVDNIDQICSSIATALDHLKLLKESAFFLTYPSFGPVLRMFRIEFAHYMDTDDKYIKLAAKTYFMKIFEDDAEFPTIVVKCEEKTRGGIQVSVINIFIK